MECDHLQRSQRPAGIPLRAQSRCLDRVGAQAAFERRQGQAWQYHQAGQSLLAMAAGRRRHGRHSLCAPARPKRAWLTRRMARRPAKVAAVALANKIARMAWAIMARGERFTEPRLLPAAV